MALGVSVNPGKSFNFVRVVTNVVMRDTNIRQQVEHGALERTAKEINISPRDIANKSRKGNIRVQENFTPQDRLIDLVV